MDKKDRIGLFKKMWYSRNPVHENNADTGEDMFWMTAELIAREYVERIKELETLESEIEK